LYGTVYETVKSFNAEEEGIGINFAGNFLKT
jgi:hypothetical protein